MANIRKTILWAAFLIMPSLAAAAVSTWIDPLRKAMYALAWFMMVIQGIRWIIADTAGDRSDAKKGIIYIIVALLLVSGYCGVMAIYCDAAKQSMNLIGIPYDCKMGNILC